MGTHTGFNSVTTPVLSRMTCFENSDENLLLSHSRIIAFNAFFQLKLPLFRIDGVIIDCMWVKEWTFEFWSQLIFFLKFQVPRVQNF